MQSQPAHSCDDLKKLIREVPDFPKPGILFYDITTLLNAGFVPVRKPKKLPAEVLQWKYELEYGHDTLEIHKDAIKPSQRVIICDDLLATGGTAKATADMVQQLGGNICGMAFVVELDGLKGRDKLKSYDVFSLLHYEI